MVQEQMHDQPRIDLELEVTPVINYALHQNGARLVHSITLVNRTGAEWSDLELKINSTPGFSVPTTKYITMLGADARFSLSDCAVSLDGAFLGSLTEKVTGALQFSLEHQGTVLCTRDVEVTALAFDQWTGYASYPELLTAFVTPNHPAIAKINARAAELLKQWGLSPALDGYMSKDPNRVMKMAGAVFGALQEQGIVYAVPPASYDNQGQRVRLCDTVLSQKMGTCLDLTLLYAGCLEAMGLHPLLILKQGHIFAGVWLEEKTFPDAVIDDRSAITKRMAKGVNEIAVVECTLFTDGNSCSFDGARKSAEEQLLEPIEMIIDVQRARLSGITPLPQRVPTEGGWTVVPREDPIEVVGQEPEEMVDTVPTDDNAEPGALPKVSQWERKLLDLGLRNQLINLRLSKSTVPILATSLDELEDCLQEGREFSVLPRPQDWNLPKERLDFDHFHELGEYTAVLRSEFQNGRLRTAYTEAELSAALKNLYRTAKTSLEENGANTLYLALGLLRWYETDRSTKARYAPVVLVPVDIVRKAAAKGYVIRLREDEAHMNITILEKLKQDFGIQVNGLDPLPVDEKGIDIRKVMTVLRQAVMDKKRWDTLESAYLGIFSFSQFVMWNDLRSRIGDLERNKIVRSLMEGRLTWQGVDMSEPGAIGENAVLLPLSADASQLFAIKAAAAGESFVLHGPPGSGKSQTITALIANALASGQSLLFVAEKMAALAVVQKRLEQIGLGPFCLELHSNKAKKRDVLEQLRRVMEIGRQASSRQFMDKAEEIAALRRDLDQYVQALHRMQPCGKTLYELIGDYEAVANAPEMAPFPAEQLEQVDEGTWSRQQTVLERLVAAGRYVGHPQGHPLTAVGVAQYSQRLRMALPKVLGAFIQALEALEEVLEGTEDAPETLEEIRNLVQITRELGKWSQWPTQWREADDLRAHLVGVRNMAAACKRAEQLHQELSKDWNDLFLRQDGQELMSLYNEAAADWFLPRMIAMNGLVRRMTPLAKSPVRKEQLFGAFTLLCDYQKARKEADELIARFGAGMEMLTAEGATDWDQVIRWASEAAASAERLEKELSADAQQRQKAWTLGQTLVDAWNLVQETRESAGELLQLTFDDRADHWICAQLQLCRTILAGADGLKEWVAWNAVALEAWEAGLGTVLDAYRGGMAHEDVLPAWQKMLSRELAMVAIDQSHVLNTFAGAVFNEKIAQFARMDREMTELTRKEIFYRLAAKLPDFPKEAAQSSEVGILQRAIRSGGRGMSLRKLFDQIPNLLERMCPCMLMSPISAAQYLDPKRKPFDLVVFDEASQLPTCKAVGALARGNNAVIVGDPKQMPPTTFFATNTVDEDHLDTEDLESILDDCLALNMPQTHLRWHYRSRHESLIAFSNSRFYEGRLLTFPSVNDRESKVRLIPVEGVFERSKNRQNRAEAQAVVDEILRRFREPALHNFSIGVVTFNIHQQELIDDLLTAECAGNPELEKWLYDREEPVFVKNLENVQGDERDVILFSIGNGPDEQGRVYMNFGPLNREGGWRRLNVAISRSKQEMMVFSTLRPEQIDLSRTGAEGVAALKAFLEYASGKELPQTAQTALFGRVSPSGIAASICRFLEEKGYRTHRNVGRSEYRIDVGVVDPADPQRYMLGILLDGPGYQASRTTRDRELAQISVLEGLGWKLLRVWSMDWWDNSGKELKRILQVLEQIGAGEEPEAETPVPDVEFSEESQTKKPAAQVSVAKPYRGTKLKPREMTAEEFLSDENLSDLRSRIRKVLAKEAPVSLDMLMRRVLRSCGINRAGDRIHLQIMGLLDYLGVRITDRDKPVAFCWRADQDPMTYMGIRVDGEGEDNRDVKDVCIQERVNALCLVLDQQVSMSREDLCREGGKILGYTRITDTVRDAMDAGIEEALNLGLIATGTGGNLVLTEEGNARAELIRKVAMA